MLSVSIVKGTATLCDSSLENQYTLLLAATIAATGFFLLVCTGLVLIIIILIWIQYKMTKEERTLRNYIYDSALKVKDEGSDQTDGNLEADRRDNIYQLTKKSLRVNCQSDKKYKRLKKKLRTTYKDSQRSN